MIDIKIAFGQRIQQLRQERGWTQEELSFQSGLSRTYIGDIERGERNIAIVNIGKLTDAFGLEIHELMKIKR